MDHDESQETWADDITDPTVDIEAGFDRLSDCLIDEIENGRWSENEAEKRELDAAIRQVLDFIRNRQVS